MYLATSKSNAASAICGKSCMLAWHRSSIYRHTLDTHNVWLTCTAHWRASRLLAIQISLRVFMQLQALRLVGMPFELRHQHAGE